VCFHSRTRHQRLANSLKKNQSNDKCVRIKYSASKPILLITIVDMPKRGLEPPLPDGNYTLNVARLPIPPLRHMSCLLRFRERARTVGRIAPVAIFHLAIQARPCQAREKAGSGSICCSGGLRPPQSIESKSRRSETAATVNQIAPLPKSG